MIPASCVAKPRLPVLCATIVPAGSSAGSRSLIVCRSRRASIRSDAAADTSFRCARSVKYWPMTRALAVLSSLSSFAMWKSARPSLWSVALMLSGPSWCQRASAVPLSEIVIIASSASSIVITVPAISYEPSSVMSSGWISIVSVYLS